VPITVNPPRVVSISFNSDPKTLRVGESSTLTPTVETRGSISQSLTFSSGDPAVATTSSSDGRSVSIVAVGAGQTTITARASVDQTKMATLSVTVLGSVRITNVTPLPVSLRLGGQVRLVPTVQADPGVSTSVTYQSASQTIATVSADGTVTGVALGSTNVTVSAVADPLQRFTVPVTVRSGVTSVSLTPHLDSTRAGLTHQLTLNVVTELGASGAVNFSSASTTVATVDNAGKVTAIAPGQTYVRALAAVDPGVGDSTRIVVVDPCEYVGSVSLKIGGTINGVVDDLSCEKNLERFTYTVQTTTALALSATVSFPSTFEYYHDNSATWAAATDVPGTMSQMVLVAPGTYGGFVKATNASQRGTFSISAAPNASLGSRCTVVTSMGITATVPLNSCGFQPTGRPAGTYNSFTFCPMFPYVQAGDRVDISVAANGFTPLIQLEPTAGASQQVIAAAGSNAVSLTFIGPPGGTFAPFVVTSRDPGQFGTFAITIDGPPARLGSVTSAWTARGMGAGTPGQSAVARGIQLC
jgi:uncharacterized protein YjdB